ncbi:hypothetical protein ACJ72_08135 [Emergomyces africanus]|uniref:Uncharacterized protein n=1 Tax=Emergomyces africanus TaxID=1955775 RepID=A0A1B7NLA1_9EURO|nr:hypothetical protein ACJ72_08135 [Emergomyces africanus]
MSIPQYMALSYCCSDSRSLPTDSFLRRCSESAISVAKQIPALHVSKSFFKVVGEKVVTPSSLVHLVVKARFIPPGSTNIPEVNARDLEDIDPAEDDIGANKPSAKGGSSEEDSEYTIQPPLAHAPYFARDHSPRWYIFLADSRQGRMAVPPFTFTTFDKPIFDKDGKPTFNVQTLKMQFQAPPQVGKFDFSLYIVCDSYIGFDTVSDITLDVQDLAKAAALQEEDDISEPDEDSIAGQMQALKTGTAPPKKRVAKKQAAESSEDDESDTDGDVDDTSETDTETDTDGE